MRLPIVPQLSTKDGAANKNARMTNALREKNKAVVRPGLSLVLDYAGVGNGLVPWNDRLIALFDDTVYDMDGWGSGATDGTGGKALALAGVVGTPVTLDYLAWNSGYTYSLNAKVTYGGTTYTSTTSGNVGVTPGTAAAWSPYTPSTHSLVAATSSSAGFDFLGYGGTFGSLTPATINSVSVTGIYCVTARPDATPVPQFLIELVDAGSLSQDFFTSITIAGVTYTTASAAYADLGPGDLKQWFWDLTNPFTSGAGTYPVTVV